MISSNAPVLLKRTSTSVVIVLAKHRSVRHSRSLTSLTTTLRFSTFSPRCRSSNNCSTFERNLTPARLQSSWLSDRKQFQYKTGELPFECCLKRNDERDLSSPVMAIVWLSSPYTGTTQYILLLFYSLCGGGCTRHLLTLCTRTLIGRGRRLERGEQGTRRLDQRRRPGSIGREIDTTGQLRWQLCGVHCASCVTGRRSRRSLLGGGGGG
mmetsp:Transcript_39089/g.98520  ORF Transcript_39089/g.98520 Transcript_39089/m.98520 type:complete len:210 (+) Transcript_39089:609-1238(+)